MKKLFFLVLTVLIVSCSSDDDNTIEVVTCDESSIPGTWDSEFQVEGEPVLSLLFNSDGTGTYTYIEGSEQISLDFTWESTDSAITVSLTFDTTFEWWVADYEFFGCDRLSLQVVWSDGEQEDIDLIFERR